MDQLVQCPVCTLYLHNGMSLESHLDTHPKDQVIKALCSLSAKAPGFGSRATTPMHSERSYRSRSRTPASDDRWNGSHRGSESDRYWCRTPSRTPKSTQISNNSRMGTPSSDMRMGDISFDNNATNNSGQFSGPQYPIKTDKTQTYAPNPISDTDQPYMYYQDHQDEREIKYSRSAEYTATGNTSNVFTYNVPPIDHSVKVQTTLLPTIPKRGNDFVKMLPKPNNILVKSNLGGVQYISPGVKPMHVMMPTTPTFVQKNVQNNMIMTGGIPATQLLDTKSVNPSMANNQFNQINPGGFTPGTTVVTQNSQLIYREMVHNIDGKPFMSGMPTVLSGHENVTQTSSLYQNVMVVDQFGNTSCMYATPQHIVPKDCGTSVYSNTMTTGPLEKHISNRTNDSAKTLIIEVGPLASHQPPNVCDAATSTSLPSHSNTSTPKPESTTDKNETKSELPGSSKGLKILSNIKVEVPVQHHKSLLNTIVDLTRSNENEYLDCSGSSDKSVVQSENSSNRNKSYDMQPSTSVDSLVSHTFSVIKNIGNPSAYKDSSKTNVVDSKIETEFSDSCPVPDLICNEKPSISPCSELSENGDNSIDCISISPKPQSSQTCQKTANSDKKQVPIKPFRNNLLRLNNIYVKKQKKILQIKNSKSTPTTSKTNNTKLEAHPSSSSCKSPENFAMNKLHFDKVENVNKSPMMHTVSVEVIGHEKRNEFDVNTVGQSVNIEPQVVSSNLNSFGPFTNDDLMVEVKEEINTSNEGGFSNHTDASCHLTPLESIRPINVISYGNMTAEDLDDESNHRELLELEGTSKSNKFVNMMNDNYFGDYADYFTPDRVESFDDREPSTFNKDNYKDGIYIWGEPSQKESEYVLPNFIQESYKIADSQVDYSEIGQEQNEGDVDGCERDSKADVLSEGRSEVEVPLNICADERMPPRGELSGQESNGDMETPWNRYNDVPPSEPYDLIARENWISDGSEIDSNEKRETLDEVVLPVPRSRTHNCTQCGAKFTSLKELRSHKSLVHASPTCSDKYSRLAAHTIKKEKKDVNLLPASLLPLTDSKETIAKSVLQVYEDIKEAKPKIERLIKLEPTKRKRRDYVCPTCKVDQGNETAFRAHLKIHPLECLTCGKCFFRRANLALHLKTHLGIKNYKCEVCDKRFLTRQKLSEHENMHTGRAPVKCTICDDTFRRYSNMVQHRARHHLKRKAKVRDYVCECGGVFHSLAKLRWHRETHEPRPKSCAHCSDKFVHAASLTRHVRRMHDHHYLPRPSTNTHHNVPCPVCKQVYLRANLRAHLLTHSGKRPYHCIVCNKSFTTKWNLKLHRWTHMSRSSKPYKCGLCKSAFIRHTEYVSHMNSHKSVRPYTCNYCGCQFIRKYNCQRHVREHEMAKKYVCKVPECGKSFHRSYYLSEHMKVHSGARPFSCSICGKTSSNKSNHNKHVKIHHAREPVATEA